MEGLQVYVKIVNMRLAIQRVNELTHQRLRSVFWNLKGLFLEGLFYKFIKILPICEETGTILVVITGGLEEGVR